MKRRRNLGQRLKIRRRSKQNEDEDEEVIGNPQSSITESTPKSKNASANADNDCASPAPFETLQKQLDAESPREENPIINTKNKRDKKRLSRKEQKDRKKQKRPASVAADCDPVEMEPEP